MLFHDVDVKDCRITYYRDDKIYMIICFSCVSDLMKYMRECV